MLNQIIETINNENIDIVCFQEIITTASVAYIQKIAEATHLKHFEAYELSPCNLVENTNCGVAIMSRFPIDNSVKGMFPNPRLSKTTSSGNTYYTFDKGYICSTINVNGNKLKVFTHHGFPFRRFNSTPEANLPVFEHFNNVLISENPDIVTGDFNAESFMELINILSQEYQKTTNEVTTVDGKKFDNVLIKKDKNFSSKLKKLLSDHYIVITTIED
jgi:endonuclease/exonuclease/phosphatase family metal-dependent hydrolase